MFSAAFFPDVSGGYTTLRFGAPDSHLFLFQISLWLALTYLRGCFEYVRSTSLLFFTRVGELICLFVVCLIWFKVLLAFVLGLCVNLMTLFFVPVLVFVMIGGFVR